MNLVVLLMQPNPSAPGSSNLHWMAGDQLPRLYKLLRDDLVIVGIPYSGQIPAHPAASRGPRSFSSTSPALSVHRSRGGVPINKQEHKGEAAGTVRVGVYIQLYFCFEVDVKELLKANISPVSFCISCSKE